MPSGSPPPGQPGGMLITEYLNGDAGERHTIRLHLAWFDPTAAGPTNDHAYVSGGPVTPTETLLSQTYAALAALWQPYYSSAWTLYCRDIGYNAGGQLVPLSPKPIFAPYSGTDTADHSADWYTDRIIRLLGQRGAKRRLHLRQVPDNALHEEALEVGTDHGGIDVRDRAWMAYLSGASGGGAVMPDGTYAFAVTDMEAWWARAPMMGWVSAPGAGATPGAPYLVTG